MASIDQYTVSSASTGGVGNPPKPTGASGILHDELGGDGEDGDGDDETRVKGIEASGEGSTSVTYSMRIDA
jgi:hypothetical protein